MKFYTISYPQLSQQLQRGDVIFRIGEQVAHLTVPEQLKQFLVHSAIFCTDQVIVDLYRHGPRSVSLRRFTRENFGRNQYAVMRYNGPEQHRTQMVQRLLNHQWVYPTSKQPWNMMSCADHNESANCHDFVLLQWLAVNSHLHVEPEQTWLPKNLPQMINQFQRIQEHDDFYNRFEQVHSEKEGYYLCRVHSSKALMASSHFDLVNLVP